MARQGGEERGGEPVGGGAERERENKEWKKNEKLSIRAV